MSNPKIVTLDGPAGVGKSTLAKDLAQELGLPFLDSGAMFRLLAIELGDSALELPEDKLESKLADFHFSLQGCGSASQLYCNGNLAGAEIRTEEVAFLAAKLGALPAVRKALKEAQRQIGANTSLVTEGRDMGTTIFPRAVCKFFLDATPEERARRRCRQLEEAGEMADYSTVLNQIISRDAQDRNRKESPLRPARDAILVDTTSRTIDQVLAQLLEHARPLLQKR